LVLATPVASAEAGGLRALVEDYVCLEEHGDFGAVGRFYQDFTQVADDEVVALLERARTPRLEPEGGSILLVPADGVVLTGSLEIPADVRGVVAFAHGSGSSRHSPRNQQVAAALREAGFATLLIDLLSSEEEDLDRENAGFRFDIEFLASRVVAVVDWLRKEGTTAHLPLGLFGASTGAAAALAAAAERPSHVAAVVSRGGRPDLAAPWLARVIAPTLLVVGGADTEVIELNRLALSHMRTEAELQIVPGAMHLFDEPGALEAVARLATDWFMRHLATADRYVAA
jgi:dienelactone hydrolase